MPKRKRINDLDYINHQIKKLKKKLKRVRKQSDSSSTSETESKNSNEDNDLSCLLEIPDTQIEDPPGSPELNLRDTEPSMLSELPSNTKQTSNEESNKGMEDTMLNIEIMEILGVDPTNKEPFGPEIHKELASRLQHITASGLTKEAKKELQQKYPLPSNGTLLGAPTMNPEIKAALPEALSNRDKAIEAKQKHLGVAISCLASATSRVLGSQNKDTELLKGLMDALKVMCDIQHSDSITRRMFSTSVLKKEVKTQILSSKIDKLLFGENLPEALKAAKAVSKSSTEIKISHNKKPQPSTSKANLNSKAPAVPFRKPSGTTQRTRQPAPHQSQPAKQFKPSSQPQKNNNSYRRS